MKIEQLSLFEEKKLSSEKLRGGYYTPAAIAEFLCQWSIKKESDTILEPSCGDGNLIISAIKRLQALGTPSPKILQQVVGIELIDAEAKKAFKRIKTLIENPDNPIRNYDFFSFARKNFFSKSDKQKFDVIIGNPPFIRYQNFPEKHRTVAFELLQELGFSANKLTNIWLPFLVISSYLLNEGGRLAMVIPSELFQVKYAAETRKFLSDFFDRITIISFKKLVFKDVQQEVVLLLCDKKAPRSKRGIRCLEVNDVEDLKSFSETSLRKIEIKPIDHTQDKWTQYYLDTDEILLLRKIKQTGNIKPAKTYISVDVGVVTGKNEYFLLSKKQIKEYGLQNYVQKIVSRSDQLKGLVFNNSDWNFYSDNEAPVTMFYPDKRNVSETVSKYIKLGEQNDIHKGYKCSIRKEWYAVPSVWVPDAFALRQVHDFPKLILNRSDAFSTDTIHRVKFTNGVPGNQIVSSFVNSLTFAFSEITGRSYGGGVLTFEPTEVEELPLPIVNAGKLNVKEIDLLLRDKRIDDVLVITDYILLKQGYNFNDDEIKKLKSIWEKLRDRRINRR